jgi:hypothetical protein
MPPPNIGTATRRRYGCPSCFRARIPCLLANHFSAHIPAEYAKLLKQQSKVTKSSAISPLDFAIIPC